MKQKKLCYLFVLTFLFLCIAGCTNDSSNWDSESISLYSENITQKGLTLKCLYYSDNSDYVVNTWIPFWLEHWNGTTWESLDTHIGEHPATEWEVPSGIVQVWSIEWSNIVGILDPGIYRIGKEFSVFNSRNQQLELILYDVFEIK